MRKIEINKMGDVEAVKALLCLLSTDALTHNTQASIPATKEYKTLTILIDSQAVVGRVTM